MGARKFFFLKHKSFFSGLVFYFIFSSLGLKVAQVAEYIATEYLFMVPCATLILSITDIVTYVFLAFISVIIVLSVLLSILLCGKLFGLSVELVSVEELFSSILSTCLFLFLFVTFYALCLLLVIFEINSRISK